ncbi:hypothetical protein [Streptomyces althioticus]|jgi:hypothetical protein|uniref:hypothetical protein n=1 Tax=Streptomyces althioticus TaxID=83380 RepID=UPI0005277994|nr:hypothetical protein [Actinospica acidiphila]WTC22008.1 hypothetical protein OG872_04765 [Streptomyces althioticus]
MDEDLARLPGPRRHLDMLEADLRAGRSCVWYFPDPVVESGRADFFVRELTHRLEAVVPVPGVVSLADRHAGPASLPTQRTPVDESHRSWRDTDHGQGTDLPDDPYSSLLNRLIAPGGSVRPGLAPAPVVPAATLEERLAKELGVTGDPVETLAEQAAAGRAPHVIVVRCWDETSPEEASRLLRVAQATFHEAGLPGRARPRFLLTARTADLPRTALGSQGRAAVHWWWRVWTRLDTEVLMAWRFRSGVTDAADALLRRVTDAVVAEVCGPDIDRALALRDTWDGSDLSTLRRALSRLLPEPTTGSAEPVPPRRLSTAHASAPDAEIHGAWARGAVDSWDGRIHPTHGHYLLDANSQELRVLVCHAQNRVLLPLIEEARTTLIHLVPGMLRKQRFTLRDFCDKARSQYWRNTDEAAVPDLEELEIGGLSYAAYMLALTTTQRHRLRTLHTARNTLSHRTPLNHDELVTLTQVLTTDWTAG